MDMKKQIAKNAMKIGGTIILEGTLSVINSSIREMQKKNHRSVTENAGQIKNMVSTRIRDLKDIDLDEIKTI